LKEVRQKIGLPRKLFESAIKLGKIFTGVQQKGIVNHHKRHAAKSALKDYLA